MAARRRLAFALVAAFVVGPQAGAATIEVEVAGKRLALPVPARMCELQRRLPADADAFFALAKLLDSHGELLAAFAACDRLATFRQRPGDGSVPYVAALAPRQRGAVRPVVGVTRAEFAARIAKDAPKVELAALAAEVGRGGRAAGLFGLSDTDRAALAGVDGDGAVVVTVAARAAGESRSAPSHVAGAVGTTIVQDLAVAYGHFDRFVDEGTLRRLAADARFSIAMLVAENPQPLTAAAPGAFDGVDWPRVAIAALVGAIAVGAIGGAVLLLGRRRRW